MIDAYRSGFRASAAGRITGSRREVKKLVQLRRTQVGSCQRLPPKSLIEIEPAGGSLSEACDSDESRRRSFRSGSLRRSAAARARFCAAAAARPL
jgi:hypothetical protein